MNQRLLLIDNYDSFTYNLVQAFLVLGAEVIVHRNDAIGLDEAAALEPTHLVISPGPGRPEDAGSSLAMIGYFAGRCAVEASTRAKSRSVRLGPIGRSGSRRHRLPPTIPSVLPGDAPACTAYRTLGSRPV